MYALIHRLHIQWNLGMCIVLLNTLIHMIRCIQWTLGMCSYSKTCQPKSEINIFYEHFQVNLFQENKKAMTPDEALAKPSAGYYALHYYP